MDQLHPAAGQCLADTLVLVPGDHVDSCIRAGERRVHRPQHHGRTVDDLQELVALPHTPRLPGGQDQGGDTGHGALPRPSTGRCPRLGTLPGLLEQPADAHGHDVRPTHGDPRQQALQHLVEAVVGGRAGAPGQPQHRRVVPVRQQEEITRVHGHAEVIERPAHASDGRGHDVTPIDDGGCADHKHHLRGILHQLA